MICWKCKKQMPEGLKYCGNCGVRLNRTMYFVELLFSKKGLPVLIGVLVLALVIAGVAAWQGRSTAELEELRQDEPDAVQLVCTELDAIEQQYVDENGHIELEEVSALLDAIYMAASEMDEVISCERNDLGVYLILENGVGFHYHAPMVGLASAGEEIDIITYQPYHEVFTNDSIVQDSGAIGIPNNWVQNGDYPDKVLKQLLTLDETSAAVETYHDQEVTIDRLKLMKGNSVIIWIGHGGYSKEYHSTLYVTVEYTEELYEKYYDDFVNH